MKTFSLIATVLSLFMISCGQVPTNILRKIDVQTSEQQEGTVVIFTAKLNLGAMSLAYLDLPIFHPKTKISIGSIRVFSGITGENGIQLNLNLASVSDLSSSIPLLPNGHRVPLLGENEVIVLDVGQNGHVYLLLGATVKAIGFALPIHAFDSIGQVLPGLNLFPILPIGDVIGTAGLFTSAFAGENGIAVVADVTSAFQEQNVVNKNILRAQRDVEFDGVELDYDSFSVSKKQKRKIDLQLYRLHQKKAVLEVLD